MISKEKIEEVLYSGFVAVQITRVLFHDSNFVRKLEKQNLPSKVAKAIKKIEQKVF